MAMKKVMHNGKAVVRVEFTVFDIPGHQAEVEEFMQYLSTQPAASVRAVFLNIDKIKFSGIMDYYRQKAMDAKRGCKAFAFVGLQGLSKVMFNFIIVSAMMPMRMSDTEADALDFVTKD